MIHRFVPGPTRRGPPVPFPQIFLPYLPRSPALQHHLPTHPAPDQNPSYPGFLAYLYDTPEACSLLGNVITKRVHLNVQGQPMNTKEKGTMSQLSLPDRDPLLKYWRQWPYQKRLVAAASLLKPPLLTFTPLTSSCEPTSATYGAATLIPAPTNRHLITAIYCFHSAGLFWSGVAKRLRHGCPLIPP